MINFPENYFDTETRCRFTIGRLMKSNWAAQLEVLEVLKDVCAKHNITFFAGFGTLLGAVRHKGFIPWDDDIDVIMKRPDYMRFLKVARQELPPEYRVLSIYYEEEWNGSFSRITNGGVITTQPEHLARYHGCPFIVGIDIFPIDYFPKISQEQTLQWTLLDAVKNNIRVCDELLGMEDPKGDMFAVCRQELLQGLELQYEYLGIPVDAEKSIQNIRNQLFRIYDNICMMYRAEECDEMVSFQANLTGLAGRWKKEWFSRAIPMGYEVTWIPVPVDYHNVLRYTFGDYRNPVYHGCHDYPYYKSQLKLLQQQAAWVLEDGLEAGVYQELPEWERVREEGERAPVPQEWQRLMRDDTGKTKKTVLYVTSLMGLLQGEDAYLQKMKSTLETFRGQQDVALWWIPCQTEDCLYRNQNPVLFENFNKICREYRDAGWGIYDDSGDYARAVVRSDGMYGDYGEICELYCKSGKPVMIQDVTISGSTL